jgi:DNA-binding NarL/FixJ family response regulator
MGLRGDNKSQSRMGSTSMLSRREIEILSFLADGKSTKNIARQLGVSPRTIEAHSASIMRKLGAANRVQAVVMAIRAGIFPDAD